MVGESTFNAAASFTVFEAILSVHHRYQGLVGRLFWIVFETALSVILGYAAGLFVAFMFKQAVKRRVNERLNMQMGGESQPTNKPSQSELGTMLLVPWISYLLAEALNLTPILTVFACGLSIGQFAILNLTAADCRFAVRVNVTISDICQSISYVYFGVAFFGLDHNSFAAGLWPVLAVFALLATARVVSLFSASQACSLIYPSFVNDK